MGIVTGVITFLIIWWTVLFATLPLGVRSQREAGAVAEGSDPGAPERPRLLWKMGLTTAITVVLWAMVFTIIQLELVDLRDLSARAFGESPQN